MLLISIAEKCSVSSSILENQVAKLNLTNPKDHWVANNPHLQLLLLWATIEVYIKLIVVLNNIRMAILHHEIYCSTKVHRFITFSSIKVLFMEWSNFFR
jgi:hypothetical protein